MASQAIIRRCIQDRIMMVDPYGGFLTATALAKDSKRICCRCRYIHGVHDWGISRNIMNAFNGIKTSSGL